MTTRNIIDCWDSGVEPYNATTKPEMAICEEHIDFKNNDCEDCKREWEYFSQFPTS